MTFRDMVPAEGMTEAVTDIADVVTRLKRRLQAVEPHARDLPADARTALDEALRGAESLLIRAAALGELVRHIKPVGHIKPVKYPRG